jgi:hypothetical protein
MHLLASELQRQTVSQLQLQRRRTFRGPVSVHINLHATAAKQPPTSPPAVKAYLDLLQGIVYPDDRQIRHLRVLRDAQDNPLLVHDRMETLYQTMRPRFPFGPAAGVEVNITVEPLRTYVSDYDRVFDIRTALGDEDDLDDSDFPYSDRDEVFDPLADDRLDDLCEEHADDLADRGLFAPGGLLAERDELRDRMKAFRAAQITGLQNKRLLGGQRLGPSDRPGPPSPMTAALKALFPDLVGSEGWYEAPISVLLPLPPTSPGPQKWKSVVVEAFTRHRSNRKAPQKRGFYDGASRARTGDLLGAIQKLFSHQLC